MALLSGATGASSFGGDGSVTPNIGRR
jgi:hypothetical protein